MADPAPTDHAPDGRPPRFGRIQIEVTSRCNFHCTFCADRVMTRPRGDMELDLLREVVRQIVADDLTHTVELNLMGEPTLYRHLDQAIALCHEAGLRVELNTNGFLVTPDRMRALLAQGTDHVLLSLQTPDEESFAARGVKAPFQRYRETLVAACAEALQTPGTGECTLSFLTTPTRAILPTTAVRTITNRDQLQRHLLDWLDAVVAQLTDADLARRITEARPAIAARIGRSGLYSWNRIKITERLFLETRILGDWVHGGLTSERCYPSWFGACEGLTEHIGVLWNGDLVFCCIDYDGNTVFGNAGQERIADALERDEVRAAVEGFRRYRLVHPYCKRCMGDRDPFGALFRMVGSSVYFAFLREGQRRKRDREPVLVPGEADGS